MTGPRTTIALLALSAALAGCASSSRRAPNRAMVSSVEPAKVEVLNEDLEERCRILGGKALYEGDILVGAVKVRSQVDRNQFLQYRWSWFDVDGFEQEVPEDRWRPLVLRPWQEKQIGGRAPLPKATRGVLELRLAPKG